MSASILFVYNADGGAVSVLIDAAHKILSPATYACDLCAVTYGALTMRREWRDYVRALPLPGRFLHRDGFRREWPALQIALPAILLDEGGAAPRVLVDAAAIATLKTVPALTAALDAALARATGRPGPG